jgi:cation transport ATPase
MTHTYSVQGMTCNGCRTSVEQKLNSISGLTKATVDLASETAKITMEHHIDLATLQASLPEKFSISEIAPQVVTLETSTIFDSPSQENKLSKPRQLKPLFLIFGFIVVLVTAKNYGAWTMDAMMLDFMGAFFLIFSLFKFFDLKGFAQSFGMYDPLAKVIPVYGKIYPFIEVALGVLFLARIEIPIVLVITILVLAITTIGVTLSLLSKKTIQCACLGTVLKLPMTQATFIENAIMIVMAISLIIKYSLL